jgi:hypothetical protein
MVGGGIDIPLTRQVSFRPEEIDHLLTAFGDNTSISATSNQNSFRPAPWKRDVARGRAQPRMAVPQ